MCLAENPGIIGWEICNLRTTLRRKTACWIIRLWRAPILLPVVFCLLAWDRPAGRAQTNTDLLTNAADVISLPAEQASRFLKVRVTGIVTAADPALKGRFFVQDATGGVFVDNFNGRRPEAGELVEVSGITYAGAYAPTITAPQVRSLGSAPLPPAKPVTVEQLMSGAEDSQRVEISGVVRDVRLDGARLAVDLAAGGYRFRAYVIVPVGFPHEKLIGSQVRIRGTAAEAHNRSLRQLIVVEVYVPVLADLVVDKPESINPFDRPVIPLNNLAQYRRGNSLGQRVHVRGVVTYQKDGESLWLQDEKGALQVESRQASGFSPGELVEAVGFPSFENFLPVLQDAGFRGVRQPLAPVKPALATLAGLQSGLHHAEYISLSGQLIERTTRQNRPANGLPKPTTILLLQASNFTFTAEADYAGSQAELEKIPIGSRLLISGICLTEIDSEGKLKSFQMLMGKPDDVRIIKMASWLTLQRLLVCFAVVCTVLIVFVSWTVMVSRKNSVLNFLIQEREKSQRALQEANDQLEERVQARTAQLKFQITARKESEVQFKAVLAERTRLAQELHDTVEQTLTGIALQLDTAAKLHEKNPPDAREHLDLARNLMSRSQLEVRQSVWDLRRLVQEHFDLSGALLENARQITAGTNLRVTLETRGLVRPLPEVVEENFLRIGREALNNVIKHAQATVVQIILEFAPASVVLCIQDNGRGFDPQAVEGPGEGHFGLLGMAERVKRVGGEFGLTSAPENGTTVRVEIPLAPLAQAPAPAFEQLPELHEEKREHPHPDR